jgi:hypothetical protein
MSLQRSWQRERTLGVVGGSWQTKDTTGFSSVRQANACRNMHPPGDLHEYVARNEGIEVPGLALAITSKTGSGALGGHGVRLQQPDVPTRADSSGGQRKELGRLNAAFKPDDGNSSVAGISKWSDRKLVGGVEATAAALSGYGYGLVDYRGGKLVGHTGSIA